MSTLMDSQEERAEEMTTLTESQEEGVNFNARNWDGQPPRRCRQRHPPLEVYLFSAVGFLARKWVDFKSLSLRI